MIVLKCAGGLCNYLRSVFSYYAYAQERSEELVVIWLKTPACNGYFLDYFEPVEGITFEYNQNHTYKTVHNDHGVLKGYPSDYTKLKLLPSCMSIIQAKKNQLGNYIAIHARRTDHIGSAKKHNCYTSDDDFFNYIDQHMNNGAKRKLYVATDNKDTYTTFQKRYSESILFPYHETQGGFRHTSLHDAIIDMFMCIYADDFKGSGYSSFTDLINDVREKRVVSV